MVSIINRVRFIISWEFFVSILIILIAVSSFYYSVLREFWRVLDTVSIRFIIFLVLFNRIGGLIYNIKTKSKSFVLSFGIILLIAGVIVNYLYRFEGTLYVADAEETSDFVYSKKGLLSYPRLHTARFSDSRVSVDGIINLTPDDNVRYNLISGSSFSIKSIDYAPGFIISSDDEELYSLVVKIDLRERKRDYFTTPVLPHRFYLEKADQDGLFRIIIMRGKIVIVDRIIKQGEMVKFEGLKLFFSDLIRWSLVEVRHYPGTLLVYSGLFLILLGFLINYSSLSKYLTV